MQGYRCHKLRKTFGKFFRSYSDQLSKFGEKSFPEYVTEGISHPVFYGDLVYKAKEKYRGVFEIQKSGDKTSSGEIGLDIRTQTKEGQI